jgi:3-oxoacyl-[acyl-carrier-protein] synthase II
MGVISPLGNDSQVFFDNLVRGHSGIVRLPVPTRAAAAGESVARTRQNHIGGVVTFDGAGQFAAPKLRMLDRVSQFALVAAAQAVRDADLVFDGPGRQRAGVFLGTGMGGAQSTDEGYFTLYAEGSERVKPFSVLMAMTNAAASWIGIEYGLFGPNLTFSTACSSSAVAIGEAARRIATGDVDVMIAGGSEAPLNDGTLVAWDALKTLAPADPNDPGASCKPFAKDRTGLVLGEGAAIVVLEAWDHAQTRGVRVHAELVGYGLCTDSAHITRPSVEGQAAAMRRALESAAMRPDEINYINAHGTATLANDAVETSAIKDVFGAQAFRIPVSSTKSMHGHLLGAAGALEFVAAVLALEQQTIPPTLNLHVPDPECDLDYVPGMARTGTELTAVMSNSFAFGGTNAVLICRR